MKKANKRRRASEAVGTAQPRIPPLHSSELQNKLAQAHREHKAGRLEQAKELCLQILAVDVRQADALNLLGVLLYNTRHFEGAIKMFCRAIAVHDDRPAYHSNLGLALQAEGKGDEAVVEYRHALSIRPDYAEALCNLGAALHDKGETEEAREVLERALAIRPNWVEALTNLSGVLLKQGELEPARARLERVLLLKPDSPQALLNMGVALQAQGQPKDALKHYERALALKPDFAELQWNRSLVQLLLGDYIAGWHNYQIRYQLKEIAPRKYSRPLWLGEPLNGARILLHAEQGLGDSLQLLRYLPMVCAAGGTVLLDVPSALRRLAEQLLGITELTVSGAPLSSFDWQCPLMTLPVAFRTTVETIPAQVPYLRVPTEPQRMAGALSWPSQGVRVGLAWSGQSKHKNDRLRSMSLSHLEPLLAMKGVHFFSLQMGPGKAQLATASGPITDLSSEIGDMADTAAIMDHLDLIITVDTSVAHLAGALAKPTWLLLPYAPDWRWFLAREDSPWYPTMRLFRQPERGDWPSVVARVGTDLAALAGGDRTVLTPRGLPADDSAVRAEPVAPPVDAMASFVLATDPHPVGCKVCAGPSALFGVVDFHKSCIECRGTRLPLSGRPVYYRRCQKCGFTFTTAFDLWDSQSFHEHIYNKDYLIVDPDFVDARPAGNAQMVATTFAGSRDSIKILDFGGGAGQFAARLRDQGFSANTYDPFSSFHHMPSERFDLVTCFEVLEHVPVPQDTVATMVSILNHPGAILFSTLVQPADFETVSLNWWYAGPRNGHISLYSSQSLALLFKRHGMKVGSFNDNLHIAYAQVPPFAAHLKLPA